MSKMLTLLKIDPSSYQAQVTSIKLNSFGGLKSITVSFYGYDPVDDEQFLHISISINSELEVYGPEFIPANLINTVMELYKTVNAMLSHKPELMTKYVPHVATISKPSDRQD